MSINNANKSAYPVQHRHQPENGDWPTYIEGEGGLTKRERFAMENFAALLSQGGNIESELEVYAKIAVKGADALLKELEEADE